jgi:flotillin
MNVFPLLAEVPSQTALVIGAVAMVLFVFFVIAGIWASRYTKVGPDEVLVVSGRKYLVRDPDGKVREVGYRVVKGGGTFVFPVYEKAVALSLKPILVELTVPNILTRDGGRAEVLARSQIRITGDDLSLARAVESLLGKTPEQVKDVAAQLLESSLRNLVGTWSDAELSQKQSELGARWQEAVKEGLGDLGFTVLSLSVRDLKIPHGVEK